VAACPDWDISLAAVDIVATDVGCPRVERYHWEPCSLLGSDSILTTEICQGQTVRADGRLILERLLWKPKPIHISSNWWLSHSAGRPLLGDVGLPVQGHSYNPLSFVYDSYMKFRFIPHISQNQFQTYLCARKICCFLLLGGWPFSGVAAATSPSSGTNGGKNENVPRIFLCRLLIELYEFACSILTTVCSGLVSLLGLPSYMNIGQSAY
jgi:hypothetical protein